MARKKYKFDNEQKKVYEVKIDKNISESSSTEESAEKKKSREEHNARKASRRATNATKKVVDPSVANENKRYDILVQYHQLNYAAIQAAIKELDVKPKMMNNQYLIINDVSYEEFTKIKIALLKCHFETTAHKEYKVRVAGYKHNAILKTVEKKNKPHTTNTKERASAAKAARKAHKKEAFANRKKHSSGRKAKCVSHRPAIKDTSNLARKLAERVKKACKFLEKRDSSNVNVSKKDKPVNKKKRQKAVQGTLNFAA